MTSGQEEIRNIYSPYSNLLQYFNSNAVYGEGQRSLFIMNSQKHIFIAIDLVQIVFAVVCNGFSDIFPGR